MAERLFADRRDAGRTLAGRLRRYQGQPGVVVLGLARGGVPVAYEVARLLGAPLDVFLVRKLGAPGHEELAMGAIASGGVVVLNEDVLRGLRIGPDAVQQVAAREGRELLRRERTYREGRPEQRVAGQVVILVDDGLATGASIRAAVQAVRQRAPARIAVAVPTAAESACQELGAMVDEVVCATTPSPFTAVGESYWDFAQTTDGEVRNLLRAGPASTPAATSTPAPAEGSGGSDAAAVTSEAIPVRHGVPPDAALFDLIGDAHVVLIGEASHGTHEFYAARAAMTRRLIEEKGFRAVAVEADWPDAYRVNRFVRGHGPDATAEESLRDFGRFPTWMWRNTEVVDFVRWLREHNDRVGGPDGRAGFYGLDLYSLYRSMDEVIGYLQNVDPAAAVRARERYACFDQYSEDDGQAYGFAAAFGAGPACQREVVEQLVDLQRHGLEYARRDGLAAEDDLFYAQQNARTVQDAERYYRAMFDPGPASWNLRDRHMVDTLQALRQHLSRGRQEPSRVVVWAHNSHLGDARTTEVATLGEVNVGQLVRERYPHDCRLIGFTTYNGTVTAADDWGGPARRKRVRAGLPDSVEELLHRTGQKELMIRFDRSPRTTQILRAPRLERAIGVIYRPSTERQSHYFHARVCDQFDAVIHIDDTRAVEPLERTARWAGAEPAETYPAGV